MSEYIIRPVLVDKAGGLYRVHGATSHKQIIDYFKLKGEFKHCFETSFGRIVTRKEAAVIAYCAGQIKEPVKKLHSSDIWEK